MIVKYLENPINPMIFVKYNQYVTEQRDDGMTELKNLDEVEALDPRIERTFYLDQAYNKFKKQVPNLICIGDFCSGKSTMLNDTFGLHFEVIEDGTASLFHDAVDAVFDSKDIPIGFNVFDF